MLFILQSLFLLAFSLPTQLQNSCQPYINACTNEIEGEYACGNYYASTTTACDSAADSTEYWQCWVDQLNPWRANITEAMSYLETCFYEESKALLTYSIYKHKVPDVGVEGLNLTTFTFPPSDQVFRVGDQYVINVNVQWGDLNAAIPPSSIVGVRYTTIVNHANSHACKMSDVQTTCSIKFWRQTDATGTLEQTFVERGDEGAYELPISFPTEGKWRVMGHVRYYVDNGDGSWPRWDIGMSAEVNILEEQEDSSLCFSTTLIFASLILFLL